MRSNPSKKFFGHYMLNSPNLDPQRPGGIEMFRGGRSMGALKGVGFGDWLCNKYLQNTAHFFTKYVC